MVEAKPRAGRRVVGGEGIDVMNKFNFNSPNTNSTLLIKIKIQRRKRRRQRETHHDSWCITKTKSGNTFYHGRTNYSPRDRFCNGGTLLCQSFSSALGPCNLCVEQLHDGIRYVDQRTVKRALDAVNSKFSDSYIAFFFSDE